MSQHFISSKDHADCELDSDEIRVLSNLLEMTDFKLGTAKVHPVKTIKNVDVNETFMLSLIIFQELITKNTSTYLEKLRILLLTGSFNLIFFNSLFRIPKKFLSRATGFWTIFTLTIWKTGNARSPIHRNPKPHHLSNTQNITGQSSTLFILLSWKRIIS